MLVSEARQEKNFQNAKEDYQQNNTNRRLEDGIKYYTNQIEEEKERAILAIQQDAISSAMNILRRIHDHQRKISELRYKLVQ